MIAQRRKQRVGGRRFVEIGLRSPVKKEREMKEEEGALVAVVVVVFVALLVLLEAPTSAVPAGALLVCK